MKVERVWQVVLVILLLTSSPRLTLAQEAYFPDLTFFPKNKGLNDIVVEHLTLQFKAVKEPSFWKKSREDRKVEAYRFLWLAANEHPICLRITKSGQRVLLNATQHDGSPGFTAGKIILKKELSLSAKQWDQLVGRLEKTGFWTAPVEVKESRGIGDGDKIVIEGAKDGKYHIIDRVGSSTKESYKRFCRSILELSGSNMIIQWDRFRQSERASPDYRPDPPETETLGDSGEDEEKGDGDRDRSCD